MIIENTEFGQFIVTINYSQYDLYLSDPLSVEPNQLHIAFIKDTINNTESRTLTLFMLSRFVNIYLDILRFEAKIQKFINIPTSNPFKDAYLRMMLEKTGQTLNLRNFEESDDLHYTWKTYPPIAEAYTLNNLSINNDCGFLTPYGRYLKTYDGLYHLSRLREGTENIIADIIIPNRGQTISEEQFSVNRVILSTIDTDVQDYMNEKFIEVGKRTAEALRYMFGYDKLRRSMRKRGIYDNN